MSDEQRNTINSIQAVVESLNGTMFRAALSGKLTEERKLIIRRKMEWLRRKVEEL